MFQSLWRKALTAGAAASQALLASSQPSLAEDTSDGLGGGAAETATTQPRLSSALEGLARIPWKEEGYLSWEYLGHKINYVDEGHKDKVN